jgi:hypothetical protein
MIALRKMLNSEDTSYPPSETLWRTVLEMVNPKKDDKSRQDEIDDIRLRMQRETSRYKPSLPEPVLARFQHEGFYYYLDPKGSIYEMDNDNPLVGNLVGEVKHDEVHIKGQLIHTIPHIKVYQKSIHETTYYIDDKRQAYRGFHPNLKSVFLVGTLNEYDKIKLLHTK